VQRYPDGACYGTVLFEDKKKDYQDFDYNDWQTKYLVAEGFDESGGLLISYSVYNPVSRGADFIHKMVLSLDGVPDHPALQYQPTVPTVTGGAHICLEKHAVGGPNSCPSISTHNTQNVAHDVVLFENTDNAYLPGYANTYANESCQRPLERTKLVVIPDDPSQNLLNPNRSFYYFYAIVYETATAVPVLHYDPVTKTVYNYDCVDQTDGQPFGLAINGTWSWPLERINTDLPYQSFALFRQWILDPINAPLPESTLLWWKYLQWTERDKVFSPDGAPLCYASVPVSPSFVDQFPEEIRCRLVDLSSCDISAFIHLVYPDL
jgi:LruC domain-containing protein